MNIVCAPCHAKGLEPLLQVTITIESRIRVVAGEIVITHTTDIEFDNPDDITSSMVYTCGRCGSEILYPKKWLKQKKGETVKRYGVLIDSSYMPRCLACGNGEAGGNGSYENEDDGFYVSLDLPKSVSFSGTNLMVDDLREDGENVTHRQALIDLKDVFKRNPPGVIIRCASCYSEEVVMDPTGQDELFDSFFYKQKV